MPARETSMLIRAFFSALRFLLAGFSSIAANLTAVYTAIEVLNAAVTKVSIVDSDTDCSFRQGAILIALLFTQVTHTNE